MKHAYLGLACMVVVASACASGPRASGAAVIIAGSVCSDLPQFRFDAGQLGATSPASSLIALVREGKPELAVYDVDQQRERFAVTASLRSRPQLLDDVVVALDAQGELSGYDAATGKHRFAVPVDRANFLGAVQIGTLLIYSSSSLSFRPSERGSTVSAVDSRTGERRWERRVPYALSRPIRFGAQVLLISDHADVWVLDPENGSSAGCARFENEPIDWLARAGTQLVAGAKQARALPGDAKLTLPQLADLPGRPALRSSDYDAVPANRSAHGRVGVSAEFAQSAAPQLANGGYAYVFYRDVFGYRQDGQLSWARWLDSDVVRTQVVGDALALLSEDGFLQVFDAANGALRLRVDLHGPIASADLHLTVLAAPSTTTAAAPLRQALAEIALDTDARLLPARLLAVSLLTALPDADASTDLLHIYTQPGTPSALRERVITVLPKRSAGIEHLIDALLEDYDFLEDRQAPPLAAILPALLAAHDARALPRLVARLFDPDTRPDELTALVRAIAELGARDAVVPLTKFLTLYHADSSFASDPAPLTAAATALADRAADDAATTALLARLAKDANTSPAFRANLAVLQARPNLTAAEDPKASEVPQPSAAVLEVLSDQAIRETFLAEADGLRACILAELTRNADLRSVRLSFVVESDGTFAGMQVLPDHAELAQCLKHTLAQLRFPAFRSARRLAAYTIAVHPDAVSSALAQRSSSSVERPFWTLSQRRAGYAATIPPVAPWWHNANPLFVAIDEAEPLRQTTPTPAQPAVTPPPAATSVAPAEPAPATAPAPAAPEDAWWLPAQ